MIPTLTDGSPSVSSALAAARALGDQELVDALHVQQAVIRAAQAAEAVLVAEMSQRIEALGFTVSGASEEVAATLKISPRSADHLTGTSLELIAREVVWAALAQARIDLPKARLILRELAEVPDPRREELELLAVGYAEDHTTHELRRKLHRLTLDKDPDESIRKEEVDKRGVWIQPRGHGMADIYGYLSLEQADAFLQALQQRANADDCPNPYDQPDRTDAQRRADALTGWLDAHCAYTVNVDVVITADALIGEDDAAPELKGLGPFPVDVARGLAWCPDARWRRLVTDPLTGALTHMSSQKYRIPAQIREAVKARDVHCRFPGCHQPARYFDIDHTRSWPHGPTAADELNGECRRHHVVKTHSAWKVKRIGTGPTIHLRWTSPLGQIHTTRAHDYRTE